MTIYDRIKAYLEELNNLPISKWYGREYHELIKQLVAKYNL
jgi:hypothetical protein